MLGFFGNICHACFLKQRSKTIHVLPVAVPLHDIEKAAQATPGSRVEVFRGCKHWSVKEQPRKFCEIVDSVFY